MRHKQKFPLFVGLYKNRDFGETIFSQQDRCINRQAADDLIVNLCRVFRLGARNVHRPYDPLHRQSVEIGTLYKREIHHKPEELMWQKEE